MKIYILLSILLFSFIYCDNYAVLVAGSNTYTNYRHQSDVFHHYHILVDRGIKPENIVVFAYDDIATAAKNPFPGKVFNSPEGKDVYEGVVIDYFGVDVNPENFIAAITGEVDSLTIKDKRTTGKVLTSTENDNVYFFYSDHGSDNLISFPNKYLYSDELYDAFVTMYDKKMYKELVFYMEACHSGSMFDQILPTNMSIYAVTAANPHESSYADYCSYDARINGTLMGTCLGDEFSCRFMEEEKKTAKIDNDNYRLEWFRMQAEQTNDMEAENEYYEEIAQEGRTTKIFEIFNKWFNLPKRDFNEPIDFDCYRKVVNAYENKCGMLIDRDFKFMTHIANFCAQGISPRRAVNAFATICE